jgi:hypothetical protein
MHPHITPKGTCEREHTAEAWVTKSTSLDGESMYQNTFGTCASSSSAKNFSVQSEGDSHKICPNTLHHHCISPEEPSCSNSRSLGWISAYLAACCVAHVHEVEPESFDDGLVCRIRRYVQLSFLSLHTRVSDVGDHQFFQDAHIEKPWTPHARLKIASFRHAMPYACVVPGRSPCLSFGEKVFSMVLTYAAFRDKNKDMNFLVHWSKGVCEPGVSRNVCIPCLFVVFRSNKFGPDDCKKL